MLMEMNQWNQTADSLGILALATVVDYSNTAECLAIAAHISSQLPSFFFLKPNDSTYLIQSMIN